MRSFRLTRRAFASGAAAVTLAACADSSDDESNAAGTGGSAGSPPSGGNQAPVWRAIPHLQFAEGVASSISIAAFVSDADGDMLSILKNEAALPPGVTYDAAGQRFVYDGIGAPGTTDDHVLTADDGKS